MKIKIDVSPAHFWVTEIPDAGLPVVESTAAVELAEAVEKGATSSRDLGEDSTSFLKAAAALDDASRAQLIAGLHALAVGK
jgi:hypothetical protein